MNTQTIRWENDQLYIIDQTLLPGRFEEIELSTLESVWEAIKSLRVRGAPAIGVSAAFGTLVGIHERNPSSFAELSEAFHASADYLATSRPTAVNLFWALDRMRDAFKETEQGQNVDEVLKALKREAEAIFEEDKAICRAIGSFGADLIHDGDGVLTHCNAGGLATADYGTALATMFSAHEQGRDFHVIADETRPLLQGARLTTWELMRAGIPVTLICDNMAAQVMKEKRVQIVIVGADRISANGDACNKIGTYGVALLAKAHGIPFYVAAPRSTIDMAILDGESIPIEQRDPSEVTEGFGLRTAPNDVTVYNPAFDVTPAAHVSGIITEFGILRYPYTESIAAIQSESFQA